RNNRAGAVRREERRLVALRWLLLVIRHGDYSRLWRFPAKQELIEDHCPPSRTFGITADRYSHRRGGACGNSRSSGTWRGWTVTLRCCCIRAAGILVCSR